MLASLRKKVDSLSPLKTQSKTIKKKETESGKFQDPFRKKTKPKKQKYNERKFIKTSKRRASKCFKRSISYDKIFITIIIDY